MGEDRKEVLTMRPISRLPVPPQSRGARTRRRGAVLAFTVISIVVLIGFASLTIDVGYMYSVRADLQNAADAAAITAASAYATDQAIIARVAGDDEAASTLSNLAFSRSATLTNLNASLGRGSTIFEATDLTLGRIALGASTDPIDPGAPVSAFNAVRAVARRDEGSANGRVELFFARIFGYSETDVTASAVAAFDDRVVAVAGGSLIPFTIHINIFENEMANGSDAYEYDATSEAVSSGSDGVHEIHLYPYDNSPGNFGLLDIGPSSNSANDLKTQIEDNIPHEHLEMTFGTADFRFVDDEGNPATYLVSGNPGLKASLQDAIQSRVGDVVGVFVHNGVSGNGANTKYNVVGLRFVRVMDVKLSGNPKYLRVQPVVYSRDGITVDPGAPSTNGLIGNLVLAR